MAPAHRRSAPDRASASDANTTHTASPAQRRAVPVPRPRTTTRTRPSAAREPRPRSAPRTRAPLDASHRPCPATDAQTPAGSSPCTPQRVGTGGNGCDRGAIRSRRNWGPTASLRCRSWLLARDRRRKGGEPGTSKPATPHRRFPMSRSPDAVLHRRNCWAGKQERVARWTEATGRQEHRTGQHDMPAECLVPPMGVVAPAASELLVGDCVVYAVALAPMPAHIQARGPSRPFVAHLKPFSTKSRRPGRICAPEVGAASNVLTRRN